ncbi:hypothetical protein AB0O34_01660 [Sphaerisporangium sp. NPDC088356]|uniref:hypothetical protein n=1 Tax=Sphaerisporangium sp. NPDC088356 TaxID=3154871 RepID=UPI00344440DF
MGRGRHKSSRGRESDSEWSGEHGGSGWHDDERGTQEWLGDASGPGWLDEPGPPHEPTPPDPPQPATWNAGSPELVRPADAWNAGSPEVGPDVLDTGSSGAQRPSWPNAWDDPTPATDRPAGAAAGLQDPNGWSAGPVPTEQLAGWDTGWNTGPSRAEQSAAWETGPLSAEQPATQHPQADQSTGWDPESTGAGQSAGTLGEQAAFLDAGPPRKGPDREATLLTEDPEKRGRRARANRTRSSRGRRVMVLSAVAAVAAIGTAVIGVKLSSSQLELRRAPDCPAGQACAAIAPGRPPASALPAPTDSEALTSPDPSDAGAESPRTSKSARPSSSVGPTLNRRSPVASARPTPDRTRTPTPRPSRTVQDTPEPVPSIEETDTASPDATPPAGEGDPLVSPGRVAVDFGVSGLTDTGYSGRLTVTNTGPTLARWSVRVPVGGAVTGADGAEWTQEGDILVVSSTDALARDEEVVISFVAEGDSTPPDGCELTGGTCRLQVTDSPQVEPRQ